MKYLCLNQCFDRIELFTFYSNVKRIELNLRSTLFLVSSLTCSSACISKKPLKKNYGNGNLSTTQFRIGNTIILAALVLLKKQVTVYSVITFVGNKRGSVPFETIFKSLRQLHVINIWAIELLLCDGNLLA